jgi:hypothetical protein
MAAAREGQLDVMRWMREQTPPCPWDYSTSYEAARGGHIEIPYPTPPTPPTPTTLRLLCSSPLLHLSYYYRP